MKRSPVIGGMCFVFLLIVSGCSSTPAAPPDRGPSRAMPELARLPDPVPKSEPKSKYGNPPTYVVLGKTYRVMESAAGYQATGLASWYGAKFHGRPTSSGERYDMYKLTAAHRNLPLPTYARITNLANNKSTIVRINDRGPFHDDRIIDLSYAAAVKLGFADHGTARVRVEALPAAPPPAALIAEATPPAKPAVTAPVLATGVPVLPGPGTIVHSAPIGAEIFLQAGAFRSYGGAESLRTKLAELIGDIVRVQHSEVDTLFRVRIGPIPDMAEALRLQALIANSDLGTPLIVRE